MRPLGRRRLCGGSQSIRAFSTEEAKVPFTFIDAEGERLTLRVRAAGLAPLMAAVMIESDDEDGTAPECSELCAVIC
ncbi:hypothetical protein Gpo141_00001072 [Globisporangium polare]